MSQQVISWGILPHNALAIIGQRNWDNLAQLKARLTGLKPFPIKLSLKPPSGQQAIDNLDHFKCFVKSWAHYNQQDFIIWKQVNFRQLLEQKIPCSIELNSVDELIRFMGEKALKRSQQWQQNMQPLLTLSTHNIYPVLVKHLSSIETLERHRISDLKNIAQQLYKNIGAGQYLRAIAIDGVDSKFLEQHLAILADLLDVMHEGEITKCGSLMSWLGCLDNPIGWLWVRPLCPQAQKKMGGLPILQLSIDVLLKHEIVASHILVVENVQSGLGLPSMKDTVAIFGGGKNISWMSATWLANKHVAYWGDIDSWGLDILSHAREKCPHLTSLMMCEKTLDLFDSKRVKEDKSIKSVPQCLNETEKQLWITLQSSTLNRLEQERLAADYIVLKLNQWHQAT